MEIISSFLILVFVVIVLFYIIILWYNSTKGVFAYHELRTFHRINCFTLISLKSNPDNDLTKIGFFDFFNYITGKPRLHVNKRIVKINSWVLQAFLLNDDTEYIFNSTTLYVCIRAKTIVKHPNLLGKTELTILNN
jgi:hypothetical protein